MGYSIGYDEKWKRDIGYGVPAICDHPGCGKAIDRGLSYVCGDLGGGQYGCGLFFCEEHLYYEIVDANESLCERCCDGQEPFEPSPDTMEWLRHKLTDESWARWREECPQEAADAELMLQHLIAKEQPNEDV